MIAICGPSGSGKTELLKKLICAGICQKAVTCTTRPPREGEIDGVHYHFVSKAHFMMLIEQKQLVEHTTFGDHYYGLPYESISAPSPVPYGVILDPRGIKHLQNTRKSVFVIYLNIQNHSISEKRKQRDIRVDWNINHDLMITSFDDIDINRIATSYYATA